MKQSVAGDLYNFERQRGQTEKELIATREALAKKLVKAEHTLQNGRYPESQKGDRVRLVLRIMSLIEEYDFVIKHYHGGP